MGNIDIYNLATISRCEIFKNRLITSGIFEYQAYIFIDQAQDVYCGQTPDTGQQAYTR
jgi:hypothetical protein